MEKFGGFRNCCGGYSGGIEQAGMLKEAGADGLLVMPFHHWLRFGFSDDHAVEYFTELGETSGLNLVAHIYQLGQKPIIVLVY